MLIVLVILALVYFYYRGNNQLPTGQTRSSIIHTGKMEYATDQQGIKVFEAIVITDDNGDQDYIRLNYL